MSKSGVQRFTVDIGVTDETMNVESRIVFSLVLASGPIGHDRSLIAQSVNFIVQDRRGLGSPKSDLCNQLAVRALPRKSFVMCVALSPKESKFVENE